MIDWKFYIISSLIWGGSWAVLDLVTGSHNFVHGFVIALSVRFFGGLIYEWRKKKLLGKLRCRV